MGDLIFYYIVYNAICLIIYGIDKFLAIRKSKCRISERWLFILALFGGPFGCITGMFLFRHKTRKVKFYLWNFTMLLIWCYIIASYIF